jgi:methionyl-tRNA formyltransferase
MTAPRIVLIGAVDSTLVALDSLIDAKCPPVLLITLPSERHARHSDFVDLKPRASPHGVPVVEAVNVNKVEIIEQVQAFAPDFIFVIGWSRLVGRSLRECATKGVLGYHPAPLPIGRGRSAMAWTILLGMRKTGGSLFWIDDGIDAGPIAAQSNFSLPPRVDLPKLYTLHMNALRRMMNGLINELRAGRLPAAVQDEDWATYFALRRPEDGQIDWSTDAAIIDRLVRAVTRPYPGAFTTFGRNRMMIWKGQPVDMPEWHAQAGQVFLIDDGTVYVRCGRGTTYRIDEYEIVAQNDEEPPILKGQPRLGVTRNS